MGINSIMGSAVNGIHRGVQGLRRVASEVASTQQTRQTQPGDLSRAMVELQQHTHQTKASVKVMKSIDESLGTLFDDRA